MTLFCIFSVMKSNELFLKTFCILPFLLYLSINKALMSSSFLLGLLKSVFHWLLVYYFLFSLVHTVENFFFRLLDEFLLY